MIREGRLLKNGVPVRAPEEKLNPEEEELLLDGEPLSFSRFEYWALNKPAGILSATEDRRHETVLSYMGLKRRGLSPCGRLDLDTTGLLLVTDDGPLIHCLLSPGRHVEKVYEVRYEGALPPDAAARFSRGITLEDGTQCRPALLRSSGNPAVLVLCEGKFHQVKRMFAALGCPVSGLKRLAMGPLSLDSLRLPDGAYRRLEAGEIALLKALQTPGRREERK